MATSQKSVRIADVARAAGVSTATVSRALSNPQLVNDETRVLVLEAIRQTGYRVNQAARNLRKQRAGAVLVLVPNLSNPFFSQILAGISATFSDSDYSVLIADTAAMQDKSQGLMNYFLDNRIDGMIALDGALTKAELALLTQAGVDDRVVFACEWAPHANFPSIRSDNLQGARLAIGHLYDLGHRAIAHLTGPEGNVLTQVRREGMIAERSRLGLPVRDDWIIRGDFTLQAGYEAAKRIVAMEHRPTAVFCAADMVAFGLIAGLQARGLRVPEDISVVGFDDIELAEYYVPALTTIGQNRPRLGARGAEVLLDQLTQGKSQTGQVELIEVSLKVRGSTAALREA